MLIIDFLGSTNSLVPSRNGLCVQTSFMLDWFESLVLRSHLFLFCFGRKDMWKKKINCDKISSRNPANTHICVHCTHMRIQICRDCPSGFFGLSRCLVPTLGSHPSTPRVVRVLRVCDCVHPHTPTYTPTPVKNRKNTDNTLILLMSKIKHNAGNQCQRRLVEPPYPYPLTLMNKHAYTSACVEVEP